MLNSRAVDSAADSISLAKFDINKMAEKLTIDIPKFESKLIIESDAATTTTASADDDQLAKSLDNQMSIDETEWLAVKPFEQQTSFSQEMINIVSISVDQDKVSLI